MPWSSRRYENGRPGHSGVPLGGPHPAQVSGTDGLVNSSRALTVGPVRRFVRNNSLAVVTLAAFLTIWLVGQTVTGMHTYNEEQRDHHESTVSFGAYLTTAHFGEATFENWESEFLQMGAYVLLTVWLRQRGSAESKSVDGEDPVDADPREHLDDPDAPWPVRRGGLALAIYKNSLSIAFLTLFALSWILHAVTGAREYSNEQLAHGGTSVGPLEYAHHAQFWFESLQNWQSEFLAVFLIVVLTIALRQQGSPESKPVHAPNTATGSD